MKNEKIEMLDNYIKAGIAPIIIEDMPLKIFSNKAVVLEADCDISLLNGNYEDTNFVVPKWYNEICEKSKNSYSLLVINNLNKVSKESQIKFLELLKYKKVNTFKLPENCIIIVACTNLKENPIIEEIYSLLVHI